MHDPQLAQQCQTSILDQLLPVIQFPSASSPTAFIAEFVATIHVHKWIYLSDTAPLTLQGQPISFVNLSECPVSLFTDNPHHHDRLTLYQSLGLSLSFCAMAITTPSELMTEVFTVKGAGTYLSFHSIETHFSPNHSIRQNCHLTIEASFDRLLSDHYEQAPCYAAIIQSDFQGCVLLQQLDSDMLYIDKFAVRPLYRGTGLGKRLWAAIRHQGEHLIWRSSKHNPMTSFYREHAQHIHETESWFIYGIGNSSRFHQWAPIIADRPVSFISPTS